MYNLFKMMRYQLVRDRLVWGTMAMSLLLGFFMANGYIDANLGEVAYTAQNLADIFRGMVYDSTFLMVLLAPLLALRLGLQFSKRTVGRLASAGHKRGAIYICLVVTNLVVFNIAMLLYPLTGVLRESVRFGFAGGPAVFIDIGRMAVYSLLLNSAMFLLAMVICFFLRSSLRAMATTALAFFVLALLLAYGMGMGWSVAFLPMVQIRYAVVATSWWQPEAVIVGVIWCIVLMLLGWQCFRRCDLT